MKIKLTDLKEKVTTGVQKLGYEGEDAQMIIDTLLYAEMRGNNQGIAKIATGGVPKAVDVEEFRVAKENKCGVLFSGGHSMATTAKAADKAVELAEKHGVGVVCINHTSTSSGAIGYFARRISKAGYIGFVCVGNGNFAAVAPTGSAERKLGTNPLAYAFPYDGGEVVFDTATAAIAFFGVVEAKLKGEPLPEGVALDALGEPTTDAAKVMEEGEGENVGGAIKTFAGHKGFGLSLFVQLMGGAFSLAGIPGANEEDGAGTFVLAIDPSLLAGKDEYLKRSRELVDQIKASKPISGQEVVLPGEKGDRCTEEVENTGEIEIADGVWNELCKFVDKS
ncbi:Ldh family oxidoreductase [Candidatus Kaiserbacteria bacterium]|nr:MAG: Ldh family oxidoreductase [Candidatus Kaiserbacteria bacterium]